MSDLLPDLSELAKSLKPGVYRHYKGGEYEFVGVALLEASMSKVVVYKSQIDATMWVRPVEDFLAQVSKDGYVGTRFVWVRG